jgi:hypothetical protein
MRSAPPLIVWMSFRLAIPWWVALPQGPPPLRQPLLIMRYSRLAGRGFFIERRTVSYLFVSAEGTSAEQHIAGMLPESARKYRPWWGNELASASRQCNAWLDAGWEVDSVDLKNQRVTFRKI